MVKNIVVIGWGQIAELLCEHENVVGYVNAENFDNIIDVNTGKIVRKVNPNTDFGVIGIGKSYYKELRSNQWIGRGYKLGVLIHPTAYVSPNAKIDEGSVVMPLAFVDDKSSVGKCSIVGPQSALRVATVGNYCHLSIQTKILPHSKIEDYVFIGSGAAILEHIVVGKSSIIGANSTVSKNIPSNHIYLEKVKNVYLRENTISYPLTEEEKK